MPGRPFCVDCRKKGCNQCEAQEGSELCVFCEDGVPCPFAKQVQQRAQAARTSLAEIEGKRAAGMAAHVERKTGKEEKPMQEQEVKTCPYPGCGKKLRADNQRGFCSPHAYQGKKAPDGGASTVKPPRAKAAKAAKANGKNGHAAPAPTIVARVITGGRFADVSVSEDVLDEFWQSLNAQGKLNLALGALVQVHVLADGK